MEAELLMIEYIINLILNLINLTKSFELVPLYHHLSLASLFVHLRNLYHLTIHFLVSAALKISIHYLNLIIGFL